MATWRAESSQHYLTYRSALLGDSGVYVWTLTRFILARILNNDVHLAQDEQSASALAMPRVTPPHPAACLLNTASN
jgi:hypothetical protein